MDIVKVNRFHQKIVNLAVDKANRDPEKPFEYNFHNAAVQSERTKNGYDGICIEWDREGGLNRLSAADRAKVTNTMNTIAQRAVNEALRENGTEFTALIVEAYQNGEDYFSVFADNDRTRHL